MNLIETLEIALEGYRTKIMKRDIERILEDGCPYNYIGIESVKIIGGHRKNYHVFESVPGYLTTVFTEDKRELNERYPGTVVNYDEGKSRATIQIPV